MTLPSESQANDKACQGNDEDVHPEKRQWQAQNDKELDSNQDIKEALAQLVLIEERAKSRLFQGDSPYFYQRLLD